MTSTVNTSSDSVTFHNMTFHNMTFHNMTIEDFYRELVLIKIPSTILIIITMILGLIGNSLTWYVYGFRLKMTPTYLFVVMLAITDFITCSMLCPLSIVISVYPIMTISDAMCQSQACLIIFTAVCNSGLLCSIAVERYRKVCCPLKRQVTMKVAKMLTLCIFLFSAVLGFLVGRYYGRFKKLTIYQGITIRACSVKIMNIYYKIIVFAFYLLVVISAIILMIVLYTIILRQLKKYVTEKTVPNAPPPVSGNNSCQNVPSGVVFLNKTEPNTEIVIGAAAECSGSNDIIQSIEISTTDNMSDTNSALETSSFSGENTPQSIPATKEISKISTQHSKRERNSVRRVREDSDRLQRITVTMMLITVAFILSYIPFACVVMVTATVKLEDNMSIVTAIFNRIAGYSFLINSCANPIIYGYRNEKFVYEVKRLFRIRY